MTAYDWQSLLYLLPFFLVLFIVGYVLRRLLPRIGIRRTPLSLFYILCLVITFALLGMFWAVVSIFV
jgi:hypothetical protein